MATLLFRPFLHPQTLGLGLGLSLATYHTLYHQSPLRLDTIAASPSSSSASSILSPTAYRQQARTPLVTRSNTLNPAAVRQISTGSIVGLGAGLLVSTFSRSLAILLGLVVVGVQFASSKLGINIIPYQRLQRYVQGVDLRSAVQDNVAFKMSFGTTFALAGFCRF